MNKVVVLKDRPKPNLRERTYKVCLAGLALALEYYGNRLGNRDLCYQIRSSIRRASNKNVCKVSKEVYEAVAEHMPLEKAVKEVIYN